MTILAGQQTSLADTPPTSAFNIASSWISDLLFGPLATTIAVIAVAWIGFAMLSGRVDIRRGISVILGCFLLFGARGIANGLRSAAVVDDITLVAVVPPPPVYTTPAPRPAANNAFDPYAGASVVRPVQ